ncbi:MAG: Rieske 2Fe-2S domain-containing protein [Gammaproteobacteria bacterium]|nr:Rieske 2Fe-2S domain-containing protein [Gammaproteobacteria bacterium]
MNDEFTKSILKSMEYERQRQAPPEEFPKFPTIPAGRYTDDKFFKLENEYLWAKSWLYVCHLDEIPETGSYLLWEKTGTPIILLRDENRKVKAYYNSCRHRGGPLINEQKGKLEGRLICKYHGWCYALNGELSLVRDKRDFIALNQKDLSLKSIKCERLGNWVFINEDPDAASLIDYLQPLPQHLVQFQPENLRLVDSRTYQVDCNVKVLLDAFFEVYHLTVVHKDTVDRFLDHRGTVIKLWENGHSVMITPNRNPEWTDPGTIGMPVIESVTQIPAEHNMSFNMFPNLVTPMAGTGMPFLTFWPKTKSSMEIDCHWFAPEGSEEGFSELWETRINNFERILEEDLQFASQLQNSVESPAFDGLNLNYQERRIYHWHEELDRRIGPDRIAEEMRVEPLLKNYLSE